MMIDRDYLKQLGREADDLNEQADALLYKIQQLSQPEIIHKTYDPAERQPIAPILSAEAQARWDDWLHRAIDDYNTDLCADINKVITNLDAEIAEWPH
jgi:hypothetical protein